MHDTFHHEHFINRELSWLEFNARVLEEAQDAGNPLLERVKFLAIFSSNLDEFFMVRVAGLKEQAFGDGPAQDYSPDGMRPLAQLAGIARRTRELVDAQTRCWKGSVLPALANEGIRILTHEQLSPAQHEILDRFFSQRAFPVLTPMAIDPSHPTPHFHNRGVYIAVTLQRNSGLGPGRLFAVVQLPPILPRFVDVSEEGRLDFILLEDVITARLPELFGGFDISNCTTFRITRDMDIELLEQESDDMLRLIEQRIRARQRAEAVRIELAGGASEELVSMMLAEEELTTGAPDSPESYSEVYYIDGPLDLTALMELTKIPGREHLRDRPFTPQMPRGLDRRTGNLLPSIAAHDILIHHPFESFDPVVDFIERAAVDPQVLAIKQTLYRTSGDSPIVRALMKAAENGKQVTALVELKARFDEERNVSWARQMERAGVHVVFGFLDLKTHCKVAMIVRQEGSLVRRYVHLGTGNYNPATALLYTDIGLFTASEDLANDATALFNLLTGYSQGHEWKKVVVAPDDLQRTTIDLIRAQAERAQRGEPSWIFAKLNSVVDHQTIEALYDASRAGVPIDLVVRGICCLRPGMPGISETIKVRSIVDRFLEHSRICIFGPPPDAQVYLTSADWMPRNFRRRVEAMFPVEAPELRDRILNEIVPVYLHDNSRARVLQPDGTYIRLSPQPGEPVHRAQEELIAITSHAQTIQSRVFAAEPSDGNGDSRSNGPSTVVQWASRTSAAGTP